MAVERCIAFVLAAALFGAVVAHAAELPAQSTLNKKPKRAEPARLCNIAGVTGVQAANGVCVRFSGYVSTGVSAGQIK